jgi:hypothetical protein
MTIERGPKVGTGEGNPTGRLERKASANQDHFQRRTSRRVPDKQIPQTQRHRIRGAGCGYAYMRIPLATDVLNRCQKSWGYDVYGRHAADHGVVPPRSFSRQVIKFFSSDGLEAHSISHLEERWGLPVGLKQDERCSADDAPPARRRNGVDPGLVAADGNAARGNLHARCRQARGHQPFRQIPQVRKSWSKAKKVHKILLCAVKSNDLLRPNIVVSCNRLEVRPERAVIANWNLNCSRRQSFGRIDLLNRPPKERFEFRRICNERIKGNKKRAIRRVNIADGRVPLRLKKFEQARDLRMVFAGDTIAERDEQRAITGKLEARVRELLRKHGVRINFTITNFGG